MKPKAKSLLQAVWSRPDPLLAEAGLAGEVLVAKVRLGLATALLLIPLINALFFPWDPGEMLVGLVLTSAIFAICLIAYLLIAREYNPPWLGFATSSFDVTVVSSALAFFLFLNQPHTAVNSKVIFEGYFLAIASTSLRYDKRVCISAGVLALTEYLAIVVFASIHWDLNKPDVLTVPLWYVQLVRPASTFNYPGSSICLQPVPRLSQPDPPAAGNQRPADRLVQPRLH